MSKHDDYRRQSGALQSNAADPRQVSAAGKVEDRRRERELNDLRIVLSTTEGRRVFWRLLEFCGVHRSVKDHSGSITYYNAGLQDTGHFIEAEIVAADEELLFKMQREARTRARVEATEAAALAANESPDEGVTT